MSVCNSTRLPAAPAATNLAAEVVRLPTKTVLEARAQEIRKLIFEAQAIADVTAAAPHSEVHMHSYSTRQALGVVWDKLDKAAAMIEPGELLKTEVRHG